MLAEALQIYGYSFWQRQGTRSVSVTAVSVWEPNSPICVMTSSVKDPMNCGVAFRFLFSDSSSTILPMANHRAALRR
jgi:hypothetical protein